MANDKNERSLTELLEAAQHEYRATGSLDATAERIGVSTYKARKLLITTGAWSSPFSDQVGTLRMQGKSVAEIAAELGASDNLVTAYLPYEKSVYRVSDRTHEAARSDHYRRRIRIAVSRHIQRQDAARSTNRSKVSQASMIEATVAQTNVSQSAVAQAAAETGADPKKGDIVMFGQNNPNAIQPSRPIRLHLRLANEYLDADERRILRKYGHSLTGISIERDVLVPADITLHALHYVIQRLYGWQNSHLRAFKLPEATHAELTGGTVRGWFHLAGVLFRLAGEDDDQYRDDDYSSGSMKSWFRSKYTGPYRFGAISDDYPVAQRAARNLIKTMPEVEVHPGFEWLAKPSQDAEAIGRRGRGIRSGFPKKPLLDLTLKALYDSVYMEQMPDHLLERLAVADILATPGTNSIDRSFVDTLPQAAYAQLGYFHMPNPPVKPITTRLIYNYDFGDNWEVEITRHEDWSDLLAAGLVTSEELAEAEATVSAEHRPVCVYRDGVNVLDDVGNLGGFVRFLKTIYESPDEEERENSLVWAKDLGWSTRKVALKNLL